MRLVALVDSVEHVCSRYRLAAFAPALAAAGHALDLRPLPGNPFARAILFRDLRTADAVILQRKLLPGWQLAVLRRYAKKLMFDFDDAVWLRDSYSPKGNASRKRSYRFARTVRAADLVIAGNDFLAAEVTRQARNTRTVVVPTCLDSTRYPIAAHSRFEQLHLVWVGSSSTLQGLERIRPLLEAVGKAIPGTRLKLVCDRFMEFENLAVDAVPWSAATEAEALASADVGITWVPDDDWSRGKCGLKVLQYQAAGLPVIANAVGVHPVFVRPEVHGFLADTADEWVRSLKALADPAARTRMGRAGREQVAAAYTVAAGAKKWIDALHRLTVPVRQAS